MEGFNRECYVFFPYTLIPFFPYTLIPYLYILWYCYVLYMCIVSWASWQLEVFNRLSRAAG